MRRARITLDQRSVGSLELAGSWVKPLQHGLLKTIAVEIFWIVVAIAVWFTFMTRDLFKLGLPA